MKTYALLADGVVEVPSTDHVLEDVDRCGVMWEAWCTCQFTSDVHLDRDAAIAEVSAHIRAMTA